MPKIALVHDYFTQQGGAETACAELYQCLPNADLFATVALPELVPPSLAGVHIHTSWMQNLPQIKKRHRLYFAAYPFGISSLKLNNYDLVISSTSSYAKGVRTKNTSTHLCYCHTPMRWVWRYQDYAQREHFGLAQRTLLPILLRGLKAWDQNAALQPDQFVANSEGVRERIWEAYRRKAVVIYPPVDVSRFSLSTTHDGYFLILSRLVPYKRLDIAIEACNRLKRQLIVIGGGPDRARLESLAGPTVVFKGRLPDNEVNDYIARCQALLFPGEEDFGLTPLEVASAGKPTVAFRGGGALETIVPHVTGVLFDRDTAASVASAIEEVEGTDWSPTALRRHASRFDRTVFHRRFRELISSMGININLPVPTAGGTDI
jgi:glycosyltransferase involved in cell wall biosynthesis